MMNFSLFVVEGLGGVGVSVVSHVLCVSGRCNGRMGDNSSMFSVAELSFNEEKVMLRENRRRCLKCSLRFFFLQ